MSDAKELSAEQYTQVLLEMIRQLIRERGPQVYTANGDGPTGAQIAEFNRRFELARKLVQS